MFEMVNIFDSFLPQLLNYPNPSDPLNQEAAHLFQTNLNKYKQKVKNLVKKYSIQREVKK